MYQIKCLYIYKRKSVHLLVFDRGSRGPSTVTLIALLYVATCGGLVDTIIVNVKLFPAILKLKLISSWIACVLKKGVVLLMNNNLLQR